MLLAGGCAPALDWRDVAVADGLVIQFPCRPERAERAVRLARRIEAGYSFINAHGPSVQDGNGPFGGFKKSGIGRNFGYEGVIQFQGHHSIAGAPGTLA